MATPRPKIDTTRDGLRVRVYARRSEFEVLIGEGDIADPEAEVWCFPKIGTAEVWVDQAMVNHRADAP